MTMMPMTPIIDEGTSSVKKRKKRKRHPSDFVPEKVIKIIDLENENENENESSSDMFGFTNFTGKGNAKEDAISVEHYYYYTSSQQTDFQRPPVKASPSTTSDHTPNNNNYIDLDDYEDDLFVLNLDHSPNPAFRKNNNRRKTRKPSFIDLSINIERGESSNSKSHTEEEEGLIISSFVCEICVEPKEANESFTIKGCSHSYCTDCILKYVASKLQDKISDITCPVANCKGLLEPEYCRHILPRQVYERWADALCEAMILALGSQRFYCPFKDCSMFLINDGDEAVNKSECPNCRRLFCAQCKVPWHADIECGQFQKLHKDEREREDIMLMKLAKDQRWARCPRCRSVVERIAGCKYIFCRCTTAFCYDCGTIMRDHSHYCYKCKATYS